jgi:hypothetical protein
MAPFITRLQKFELRTLTCAVLHLSIKVVVVTHRLAQLYEWVEKAAARIDVKFAH